MNQQLFKNIALNNKIVAVKHNKLNKLECILKKEIDKYDTLTTDEWWQHNSQMMSISNFVCYRNLCIDIKILFLLFFFYKYTNEIIKTTTVTHFF